MKDTKIIGEISEAAITLALLKRGYSISKPIGENSRYDLIVEIDGKLNKVQCKTAKLKNDVVIAGISRVVRTKKNGGYQKISYDNNDVDFFGIYCPDTNVCYLVPFAECPKTEIRFRVKPSSRKSAFTRESKKYEI